MIDVTARVVSLKGNKEFRAMWINRDRVGEFCVSEGDLKRD